MVFTWLLFWIILFVEYKRVFSYDMFEVSYVNWQVVESLAEENPYIVALLTKNVSYVCTGTVVNKRTVLTSGTCIKPELFYISIGLAVLNKFVNRKHFFEIENALQHPDYTFEIQGDREEFLNVTQMHSNIGLVFSRVPTLDLFLPAANLGNYYAPELQGKDLMAIGYGSFGENVALLYQNYHQSPCYNPKWYYCVCGYELPKYLSIYRAPFGEGAPVFLGSELVGITATPCRTLEMRSVGMKYNIITVIGPYVPWLEKTFQHKLNDNFKFRSRNDAKTNTFNVYLLIVISQVLN